MTKETQVSLKLPTFPCPKCENYHMSYCWGSLSCNELNEFEDMYAHAREEGLKRAKHFEEKYQNMCCVRTIREMLQ